MPLSYGSAWWVVGVLGFGPRKLPAVTNNAPTRPPRPRKTMAGRYVRSTRPPVVSPTCNLLPQSGVPHLHTTLVTDAAHVLALLVAISNGIAGVVSAFLWWRVEPHRFAWVLIRAGQAFAVLQAVGAGVLAATGLDPDDSLYWLYA